MTIGLRNSGAWSSGSTSVSPSLPASPAAGDRMVLFVASKPYSVTINTPTGWTQIGTQQTNGSSAAGIDTGSVTWAVFYRDWQSGDTAPSVSITGGNVSLACIHGFTKTEASWDTTTAYFGSDTSTNTNYSATVASSSGNIKGNDYLAHFTVIAGNNATFGSPTITATSATIGTVTEDPASEGSTATGNDLEASCATAPVTSGTSSADAVCGWTLSASQTGGSALVRMRENYAQALSGQAVTVTQGTIVSNVNVALTGQSLNVSGGTLLSTNSVALSGQAVTVAQDSVGASGPPITVTAFLSVDGVLQTSGIAGASSLSSGIYQSPPVGDTNVALTGQSLSTAIGSLTATITQEITGQSVSVSSGTIGAESFYLITPSGGVVVTGNNTLVKTKIHVVSGGISISGSNTLTVEKFYNISPSGGIVLSGTNPLTLTKSYTITPSGGITLSGTNALTVQKYYLISPSGGIVLSGTNNITPQYYYTITPSGGVVLSGSNAITYTTGAITYTITPNGGITLSGNNVITAQFNYTITPSGGVVISGTVPLAVEKSYTITPSGGVVLSGANAVTLQKHYVITPSGGIVLSGSNPLDVFAPDTFTITPSGGITLSGENLVIKTKIIIPSGGIIFSGSNPITTNLVYSSRRLPLVGVGQ